MQRAVSEKRIDRAPTSLYLVVIGMWIIYGYEALKSLAHNYMPMAYFGYLVLFVALFIELKNRRLKVLPAKYSFWLLGIWLYAGFALCYGALMSHELQFISRDIWPFGYFACFMVATHEDWWATIDKMIYFQFIVAIVLFIYIMVFVGVELRRDVILASTLSWDQPRISWAWMLLFGWPYMFLSFNYKTPIRRKVVTIVGISLYLFFAVIFLKRQPWIEVSLLLILKVMFLKPAGSPRRNTNKFILTSFLVMLMLVFGLTVIDIDRVPINEGLPFAEKLYNRLNTDGSLLESVLHDDRVSHTPSLIIEQAGTLEILWGQGLGSVVERANEVNNAVESGLFTLFLKGGIIYLLIWYSGLFTIITKRFAGFKRVSVFTALSTLTIVLSPLFTLFIMFPATGYFMFWIGRSATEGEIHESASIADALPIKSGVPGGEPPTAGRPCLS